MIFSEIKSINRSKIKRQNRDQTSSKKLVVLSGDEIGKKVVVGVSLDGSDIRGVKM